MTTTRATPFQLPPLPYADNALEPVVSARALGLHHKRHHRGYVDTLNGLLVEEPELASLPLAALVRAVAGDPSKSRIFDAAAQAWNHEFFWSSMKPGGGGKASGRIAERIDAAFGGHEPFVALFAAAAKAHFGSGWVWLIEEGTELAVVTSANADTPMARGQNCLLTLDVWEHAYYLDYQERRLEFAKAYLERLVNWDFAERNLALA
jgi:Fe-Mn family superoxide dismutase